MKGTLLQISGGVSEVESCGVGFIVIVKVFDDPGQSFDAKLNEGVTVIFASIGEFPGLVAVKDKLPEPLAASPIDGLSFTQPYDVVPTVLIVVNATAAGSLLQKVTLAG